MYRIEDIKTKLSEWSDSYCESHNMFLVDVIIKGTKYEVLVDTMTNVTVEECAQLNRFLQKKLDEDSMIPEIYTLDVSSPGMSNPLKIPFQYKKRIGKDLIFTLIDGTNFEANILSVEIDFIEIEQIIPASKKLKTEAQHIIKKININEIKKALIPLKFNKK